MSSRLRDEQEIRNAAEVMVWVRHLADHDEVPLGLDLVCHINRLTLRGTGLLGWPRAFRGRLAAAGRLVAAAGAGGIG